MTDYTTFLYARPSFLEGMARVIDLGGTLTEYNVSQSGSEADYYALNADARAIGQDMRAVISTEVEGSMTEEPEAVAALSSGQEE